MNGSGRTAVVLGGAGKVGSAIACAMLRDGWQVAVPSRSEERRERLRARAGADAARLYDFTAEVGDEESALGARSAVESRFGAYDTVVVSLGTYYQGKAVVDTPISVWNDRLHENFLTHVIAARVFLPPLLDRPGSSYIAINGLAADNPRAGAAPITVTGVAQAMLMRQLAAEHRDGRTRIQTVMLGPVMSADRGDDLKAEHPEWITDDEVGEFVALVASPAARVVHDSVIRLPYRPAQPEA